jgi:hypothetical protein
LFRCARPRPTRETLRLLASYADLVQQMPAPANPKLRELVEQVRDLMALALGGASNSAASDGSMQSAKGGGMRAARLRAIKADILAHLGARDVSLDAVARRQGISPIYVCASCSRARTPRSPSSCWASGSRARMRF